MDTFTKKERSAIMRAVKSKNTAPEMKVRKAIHSAGFRYRLHSPKVPGSPDLVFTRYRLVVFVHGCFWHWHGCKRCRMPSSNKAYWERKIKRNVERDRNVEIQLKSLGWKVMIIWECSLPVGIKKVLKTLQDIRRGGL